MSELAARVEVDRSSPEFAGGAAIHGAIREFAAAAMRADGVDPMVTEFVRLRCAQIHDCRQCKSVRLDTAYELGFDERMNADIARYETVEFEPAVVAALRLTDAIILAPSTADAALSEELHTYFSDSQIAEICLDVVKWSEQKQLVSLRLEPPVVADEPPLLSFDSEGEAHRRRRDSLS